MIEKLVLHGLWRFSMLSFDPDALEGFNAAVAYGTLMPLTRVSTYTPVLVRLL